MVLHLKMKDSFPAKASPESGSLQLLEKVGLGEKAELVLLCFGGLTPPVEASLHSVP